LVLTRELDVRDFHFVEIQGTSTNHFSYVVEYKLRGQQTPVVASGQRAFPPSVVAHTEKVPMEYDGSVGEVVLNFYESGEFSELVISAVRLVK
jgi:hypothetical protein